MAHSVRLWLETQMYRYWFPVPAGLGVCNRGCAYTVLQTIKNRYSIRVGHSPDFGLPSVVIVQSMNQIITDIQIIKNPRITELCRLSYTYVHVCDLYANLQITVIFFLTNLQLWENNVILPWIIFLLDFRTFIWFFCLGHLHITSCTIAGKTLVTGIWGNVFCVLYLCMCLNVKLLWWECWK